MPLNQLAILIVLGLAQTQACLAAPATGHIKYQPGITDSADESAVNQSFDIRVIKEDQIDDFRIRADAQAVGAFGSSFGLSQGVPAFFSGALAPKDDRRFFRLTHTLEDSSDSRSAIRFDRLYLDHSSENLVLRAGRDALTWGSGFLFQALDPFNPFSPTAVDKDYKIGDDMLYGQYSLSEGRDIQIAIMPRRNIDSGRVAANASSFAGKFHGTARALRLDYDLIIGRHYESGLVGLGLSRSMGGAVFRLNLGASHELGGKTYTSLVANADRSFSLLEKNFYLFLEYFHSGFGEPKDDYLSPSAALTDRLLRGELYTIGKDYAALGARLETNPRLNLYLNGILNLGDQSSALQARAVFDWLENSNISIGGSLPFGGSGTEYGGFEPPAVPSAIGPGNEAYLRLALFF